MAGSVTLPKPKKHLNANALIAAIRRRFDDVQDTQRIRSVVYNLTDTLNAAMAMFSLKEPSLLAFVDRRDEPAIRKLFGIKKIPSDSTMREILDGIDIDPLNEAFADVSTNCSGVACSKSGISTTGIICWLSMALGISAPRRCTAKTACKKTLSPARSTTTKRSQPPWSIRKLAKSSR